MEAVFCRLVMVSFTGYVAPLNSRGEGAAWGSLSSPGSFWARYAREGNNSSRNRRMDTVVDYSW